MVSSRYLSNVSIVGSLESLGKYGMWKGGGYPQRASNGVIWMEECHELLYHQSANANHLDHVDGLSKHLFTTLVCPSYGK